MMQRVKEDSMQMTSPATSPALRLLWALNAPRLIGKRIKQRREELGWSQQRLAEESGVSVRTIPRLEAGEFGRLRKHTADGLSDALGIPPDELRPPVEEEDESIQLDRIEQMLGEILSRLPAKGPAEVLEEEAARLRAQRTRSGEGSKRKPQTRKAS